MSPRYQTGDRPKSHPCITYITLITRLYRVSSALYITHVIHDNQNFPRTVPKLFTQSSKTFYAKFQNFPRKVPKVSTQSSKTFHVKFQNFLQKVPKLAKFQNYYITQRSKTFHAKFKIFHAKLNSYLPSLATAALVSPFCSK